MNLDRAREKAAKLSQYIRRVSPLLLAAQSVRGNINSRMAEGLQELLDVTEAMKGMSGHYHGEELENIIQLLCERAERAMLLVEADQRRPEGKLLCVIDPKTGLPSI